MASDEGRGEIRDRLEEVFRRYELREEAPSIPRVEKAPRKIAPPVEVSAPSLVETGIPGLDMLLGGGLPDHSLILLLGEPGSHYQTFLRQILYNHVQNGGKVAYYVAETFKTDVQQDMEVFGWSLGEHLSRGSWVFINLRTQDLQELAELSPRVFSNGFSVSLAKGLNRLKTDLLSKIREDRWTAVELCHILYSYNTNDVISLILYWRTAIRIYGGIHFAHLPLGVHKDQTLNSLKHLVDGVFEFSLREGVREYETVLAIRKLRGLRRSLMITFTVEETGISIETIARIA